VRDRTGIVAALSVPSPLVRAPETLHEELIGRVRVAARDINAALRAAHR
jgi:DNA-binding IclR family transcriptional regulator